jgi:hypothetical protein
MNSSGLECPRIQRDVDCVFLESVKRDDLKRSLMGGCEDDVGCGAVLVRLEPVGCGHTPPIAGREPGESILRHRRDQVVADSPLMLEKLGGDHGADRVAPQILGTGVAAPIAKETGDRVGAAGGKRSA